MVGIRKCGCGGIDANKMGTNDCVGGDCGFCGCVELGWGWRLCENGGGTRQRTISRSMGKVMMVVKKNGIFWLMKWCFFVKLLDI